MGLIVDSFAGGGGASLGIEMAMGRPVDIAVNHDPEAIAMHRANHPHTRHFCESVWEVDPAQVCSGQTVDLLWASPDCKDFSKAKGGKPIRNREIRSLAWVVVKWAQKVRPSVIVVENVEEFMGWGPLDKHGVRIPERQGETFGLWVKRLRRLGYRVEWKELRACDYGAPTIRKRLFIVARCDGEPIVWPESSHGPGQEPVRIAAECIDWSVPCPSVFERKRPLAENTLKRIANGIRKFVIEDPNPFIVSYYGPKRDGEFRGRRITEPLPTQSTENRFGLVMPYLAPHFGQSIGQRTNRPATAITAGGQGKSALVAAFMAKHFNTTTGQRMEQPLSTLTSKSKHSLVTSHLIKMRSSSPHGQSLHAPLATITGGGKHFGEVRAFLTRYNGCGTGQGLKAPMLTVTSKERLGLVTVAGEDWRIVDIGMRMLIPRELYRAQGFPDSYKIEAEYDRHGQMAFPGLGKPLTKTAQVRMVGNSVCPPVAAAVVRANCGAMARKAAA